MRELHYLNLDLLIEPVAQPDYRVRILASPAGETRPVPFHMPFSDLEVENFLLRIGRPRRNVRRINTPEVSAIKDFGGRLFEAVFPPELRTNLAGSLGHADAIDAGLRIRLRLSDCPELSELPWEYLYDREHNRFLSLSDRTPLIRYLEVSDAAHVLSVRPPLHILVVIASPSDFQQLDVEQEWRNVTASLTELRQRGRVEVERLAEPTLRALQRQLRRDTYHVLHFIGHGGYDPYMEDGVLAMEDDHGRAKLVGAEDFGTLLHDHRSLRLAVLNACEGGRGGRTDPFSGTAQSLVRQGVPAVVAMQFEITDDAAITFSHALYEAIADGYAIDASTAEARKAIYAEGNLTEWGTPVLYLRAPDGRIFDIGDGQPAVFIPSPSARSEKEQAGLTLREAAEQAQQEDTADAAHYEHAGPAPANGDTLQVTEPELNKTLVEGLSKGSEAAADQPVNLSRAPRSSSRRTRALVIVAAVVAAVFAGWLLIRFVSRGSGEVPAVSTAPNTSSPRTSTTASRPTVPQAAVPLPKDVIVFPEGTKGNEDIWTVRADGSQRKRLVGNRGTDTWPVISHDRKTVLYVHIEKGNQTLRLASVDGKDDRLFADVGSICKLTGRPAWSSTGMIAVVCVEGPRIHSIKLVNMSGTVERTLVPPVDYVEDPAFSNDGKLLVYWKEPSTNELEGGPIYEIGVDGHGERRITDGGPGQDADPAWSPDDEHIAFRRRADRQSARDIWILDVRTGDSQPLVTGPSNDQDPSWSPDGRRLVYKCGPNGDAELCTVGGDGRDPHRLFQSDEPNTAPAWTPR